MAGQEFGTCEICSKEAGLSRTYFNTDIICACCSPTHFKFIRHCASCAPDHRPEVKDLVEKVTELCSEIVNGVTEGGWNKHDCQSAAQILLKKVDTFKQLDS